MPTHDEQKDRAMKHAEHHHKHGADYHPMEGLKEHAKKDKKEFKKLHEEIDELKE